MPKLKEKIDQAAYDALPESIAKSELYTANEAGGLSLQWEGLGKDEKALRQARTQGERAEGRLKRLVPKISELKPEEWDAAVDEVATLLEDVRDSEFDVDEWRKFKASGKKIPESELQKQLAEAQTRIFNLDRDLKKVSTERDALKTADAAKKARIVDQSKRTALGEALDDVGVTAAHERKVAFLLLENKGLVHREADGADHFYVKEGAEEIELADYVKTWAGTDEGKRYVAHPDSSGGGETGAPARTTTTRVPDAAKTRNDGDQKPGLSGRDMLADAFSKSAGTTAPASGR